MTVQPGGTLYAIAPATKRPRDGAGECGDGQPPNQSNIRWTQNAEEVFERDWIANHGTDTITKDKAAEAEALMARPVHSLNAKLVEIRKQKRAEAEGGAVIRLE